MQKKIRQKNKEKKDPSKVKTLKIWSDLTEVKKVRSFLRENLKGLNLSDKAHYIIELSLLEICINIIKYAYPEGKGEIFLKTWQQKRDIFFEIRDNGIPFDPTESEMPDIEEIIKNEKIGGLGIFLARNLMDGFSYKRENNQNIMTIYKKIKEAESSESV